MIIEHNDVLEIRFTDYFSNNIIISRSMLRVILYT